jgi:hypothetical protein
MALLAAGLLLLVDTIFRPVGRWTPDTKTDKHIMTDSCLVARVTQARTAVCSCQRSPEFELVVMRPICTKDASSSAQDIINIPKFESGTGI